jgi:long-chain acyl-CoA synthetase
VEAYASLPELIGAAVERRRDGLAFANFDGRLTYAEFDELSRRIAAFLQQRLGLGKGDRIALMLPNVMQFPVCMYGALRAGLTVVNVNPLYSPRELEYQVNDAGAETLVILADMTPTLGAVLDSTCVRNVIVTQLGDLLPAAPPGHPVDGRLRDPFLFREVLSEGGKLSFSPAGIEPQDVAFLQYTGGTTGVSKGAMLTHRNLVANCMQMEAVFRPLRTPGEEIYITALPLYHVFALTVNCLNGLYTGGTNVLITNPRDMPAFVRELGNWRFTFISGVNTLLNGLLNTPGFAELDFSGLRTTIAGGMALQSTVAKRWQEVTGRVPLEGYGLSETSPCLSCNPADTGEYNGTIGIPLPGTLLAVRDDAGHDLPPGTPGELCAKGPQVMAGYWNRPEETQKVMTADGFFRTGDIAVMDERGFFRVIDRKKDMINVSGLKVFPNEVEDVAAAMEGVLECACVGAPDAKSGECVVLFVVPKAGVKLDAEAVRAWCRGRLAPFKQPQRIEFVDAIPKSNVGKILRRELRARIAMTAGLATLANEGPSKAREGGVGTPPYNSSSVR